MIFSMTGFGRAGGTFNNHKIIVEAKSLNSKQLDLNVRMPSRFRDAEMELRDSIAKKLERGKVDVNIYVENISGDGGEDGSEWNMNAIRSIKNRIEILSEQLNIPHPADWFQLLFRFPEVLHSEGPSATADKDEIARVKGVVDECVEQLLNFRKNEGLNLEKFFITRIENIRCLLEQVAPFETERIERIKARIREGLAKLNVQDVDKNRFEQELIYYIEKLDVSEEKQRLAQHLNYFVETMNQQTAGQGKKLGFIAQEIGREINTLGSKSNHAEMQKIVVKMKDELEQIKEQVLNVM